MSLDSTNIFQKLLDQIYVYNLNETHPDTFNSLRLEKQAKKLDERHPDLAASARGLIAAIQGNLDESDRQHVLAKKLSRHPHHKMYQAMSLRILGEHESSYFFMQCIMSVMPDPVSLLSSEIYLAFKTGHHIEVTRFHHELLRIKAEIPIDTQLLIYFNHLIDLSKISLDVFPKIRILVHSLQKTFKIEEPEFTLEKIDKHLYCWLTTEADPATITQLNTQLASGMALITGENLDRYHIGYRAHDDKDTKSVNIEALHNFVHDVDFYRYDYDYDDDDE
jgi:hypothetical protein